MKSEIHTAARRSGEIDLWKFIFAVVIIILHSSYLPGEFKDTYFHGGSIGVEFFFIVSGFYLAKSAEKVAVYQDLAQETYRFLKKKIQGFFPYMFVSFLIALTAKSLSQKKDLLGFIKNGVNGIVEISLIRSTGIGNTFFNTPAWYLSAMICSMAVLYPLSLKYKKAFTKIVCPLTALFILGYLYQKYGQFRTPDQWDGLFLKGTIRGLAEISLGIVCYEICSWMSGFQFTMLSKMIFAVIEYGSLAAIIIYSNTETCWDMDCPSVILMGCAIIIAGGNLGAFSEFWSRLPVTQWLGRFSLMLYLNHIYWVYIFSYIKVQGEYPKMLVLYLVCTVLSSLFCWRLTDGIRDLYSKNREKVLSLFVSK